MLEGSYFNPVMGSTAGCPLIAEKMTLMLEIISKESLVVTRTHHSLALLQLKKNTNKNKQKTFALAIL